MALDKQKLYRLPWSMNDNPIGWLEITDVCNIHCKGCYRQKLEGHKPLDVVKDEILFLKKWRNCDNISIAGGDPLTHPDIIEIVRFIAECKIKPILLTNGVALTRDLLSKLKSAGLSGIVFHIDMWQNRPGWKGKSEEDLCDLRQYFADMVYDVANIPVNFNITVYRENLKAIPFLVKWAIKNVKKVQGFIFITYRSAIIDSNREYLIDGKKIEIDEKTLGYASSGDMESDIAIKANDVYEIIKKEIPEYEPAGYLGGTKRQDTFKWVIGMMLCGKNKVFGSIGKRAIEIAQVFHHLFCGTYFVYLKKKSPGKKFFILSLFDRNVRETFKNFIKNPLNIFRPVYGLGIGIIQAPDVLEHGEVDMCDSCPDMCVFEGRLVNSCRLDEYRKFGTMITPEVKKEKNISVKV